jgi:hypothetical protein
MKPDWDEIIQRHLSGLATEDETQLLAASLKSDDALADLYVRHIGLEVALEATASSAEVTRELLTSPASSPARFRILRRPLTAAAAGIAFGMICTSMVFGYMADRTAVQMFALPVFDPGLEGLKPLDKGLPHDVDEWGVRAGRIVPAENGVQPARGERMLRLEPALLGKQDENLYAHAYQILDLRSLPREVLSDSMEALVSASFRAARSATKARNYIRVYALNEPPGTAADGFWSKDDDAGVVALTRRFEIESGDGDWHSFSVKMPLPPDAQTLVVIFSATSPRDETIPPPISYLDEVQVTLLTSPAPQP